MRFIEIREVVINLCHECILVDGSVSIKIVVAHLVFIADPAAELQLQGIRQVILEVQCEIPVNIFGILVLFGQLVEFPYPAVRYTVPEVCR